MSLSPQNSQDWDGIDLPNPFQVEALAHLVHLELSPENLAKFSQDIAAMWTMCGSLAALDAEPDVADVAAYQVMPLRSDQVAEQTVDPMVLVRNAAKVSGDAYCVPPVVA